MKKEQSMGNKKLRKINKYDRYQRIKINSGRKLDEFDKILQKSKIAYTTELSGKIINYGRKQIIFTKELNAISQ